MREFDYEQVSALLSGPRFVDEPTERVCPACGALAVRTYVRRGASGERATRITYSWCASCRRFKGWTGPDPGDLEFFDPLGALSEQKVRDLQRNFDGFLRVLDEKWDAGELPQNFTRIR